MSDSKLPGGAVPPQQGPLTPVYVVFPGEAYPQVWAFLWVGIAYVMAGFLPWGPGKETVVGGMQAFEAYDPAEPMGLMRCIVVLLGFGMAIACVRGIFTRSFKLPAILLGGVGVFAELWFTRFYNHVGALLAEIGGVFGGSEAEQAALKRVYLERGPGYYLALLATLVWVVLFVMSLLSGFKKVKAREEAKKSAQAAEAAERAAARKAAAAAAPGDKKP
ncbi:MAG TPA: hypothetical protein VEI02_10300 [Planctomycetota bacterium]|nr:hypothetical protein [Planctomycetota bacterium]